MQQHCKNGPHRSKYNSIARMDPTGQNTIALQEWTPPVLTKLSSSGNGLNDEEIFQRILLLQLKIINYYVRFVCSVSLMGCYSLLPLQRSSAGIMMGRYSRLPRQDSSAGIMMGRYSRLPRQGSSAGNMMGRYSRLPRQGSSTGIMMSHYSRLPRQGSSAGIVLGRYSRFPCEGSSAGIMMGRYSRLPREGRLLASFLRPQTCSLALFIAYLS